MSTSCRVHKVIWFRLSFFRKHQRLFSEDDTFIKGLCKTDLSSTDLPTLIFCRVSSTLPDKIGGKLRHNWNIQLLRNMNRSSKQDLVSLPAFKPLAYY